MSVDLEHRFDLASLTPAESEALVAAAAWYFNYHCGDLERLEGDESVRAIMRREHLEELHAGLWRLDVKLHHPVRHR